MTRLSDRALAVLLVAAVSLGIVGIWGGLQLLRPSPPATEEVSVSLRVEAEGWQEVYAATTENNTVLGLLLEAGERRGFAVAYEHDSVLDAVYVTAINGVDDGEGGRFWQYWVNGEYAAVGADWYVLEDGDAVVWHHTSPQEGVG